MTSDAAFIRIILLGFAGMAGLYWRKINEKHFVHRF